MNQLQWPEHNNLELRETDGGILVSQNRTAYIARKWQLTKPVVEVVQWALDSGLHWLIQNGHPKESHRYPHGNGGNYIAFSPVQENLWVFAIDEQSPSSTKERSDVRQAVFQKKYRAVFDEHGIRFKTESRNTRNLLVEHSDLREAIAVAGSVSRDIGTIGGSRRIIGSYRGFIDEAHLQGRLLKFWDAIDFGRPLECLASEYRISNGRRIDILARDRATGAVVVLELKQQSANETVIMDQIVPYLEDSSLRIQSSKQGRSPWGCLIAEQVPQKVREAVRACSHSIVAFEAIWTEDGVSLKNVAGVWPSR